MLAHSGLVDLRYPPHSMYQPPLSWRGLRGGNIQVEAGGSHARLQRHSGRQALPG